MFKFKVIMTRPIMRLLENPAHEINKMFGLWNLESRIHGIISSSIMRNFSAMRNEDGRNWANNTDTTYDIKVTRGIAKFTPFARSSFAEVMKATGEYYYKLKDMEAVADFHSSVEDITLNSGSMTHVLNTAQIPQLWNEFNREKTTGAIKKSIPIDKRSVVYYDEISKQSICDRLNRELTNFWK